MLHVPAKNEFPMDHIKSQGEWLNIVKSGACQSCHALGTPGTRTDQQAAGHVQGRLGGLGGTAAGRQRVDVHGARHHPARHGQGARTVRQMDRRHRSGRAAVRQTAAAARDRTQRRRDRMGMERRHGLSARRNRRPTAGIRRVNANGKIYGSPEDSTDFMPVLDPATQCGRAKCKFRCAIRTRRT